MRRGQVGTAECESKRSCSRILLQPRCSSPDSLCPSGLGAANLLEHLQGQFRGGAGRRGGRVPRPTAVRTSRLPSPSSARRGWGKRGLSGGETRRLAEGWVRNTDSRPRAAQENCTCHQRAGRAVPGQEGPHGVRRAEEDARGQLFPRRDEGVGAALERGSTRGRRRQTGVYRGQ